MAHDQEVYDVAFSNLPYMFGSVGGDGSLRLFDLRYSYSFLTFMPVGNIANTNHFRTFSKEIWDRV